MNVANAYHCILEMLCIRSVRGAQPRRLKRPSSGVLEPGFVDKSLLNASSYHTTFDIDRVPTRSYKVYLPKNAAKMS